MSRTIIIGAHFDAKVVPLPRLHRTMFQFSPFFVLRAFALWNSFPNLQFLSIVVLCRPPCTRCTRAISILTQGECAACVQSKTGEGKKNQQLYFFTTPFTQPSLADLLFFYEFKMFVHSSDSNRRDSISQKNPDISTERLSSNEVFGIRWR